MQKQFLIIAGLLLGTLCGKLAYASPASPFQKDQINLGTQQGFTIKGNISGLDQTKVTLSFRRGNHDGSERKEEYVVEVKGGNFEIEGPSLAYAVYAILECKEYMLSIPFWLENGQIEISGDIESSAYTISGSKTEDEKKLFHSKYDSYVDAIWAASSELNEAKKRKESSAVISRVEQEYQKARQDRLDYGAQFVRERPSSQIALNFLYNAVSEEGGEYADRLLAGMDPAIRSSAGGKRLQHKIDGIKNSRVGKVLQDYNINNKEGDPVKFSDYQGRYLLLTMSSGLNGTYQRSVELRKTLQLKYHHKGLEQLDIVFNLNDKADIEQLTQQLGISWPILSDYKGLGSGIIDAYNVTVFPTTFVIDPSGVILSRVTKEKELEEIISDKLFDN
ncbi:MAG: AhpC/TSA family protein [Sphingobacterium sp.]|jgi:peroxiredoxin|nr:AhpC/TSA family protein [Sphingobacterium sp.]